MIYHLNEKLFLGKREATAEAFRDKCADPPIKIFSNIF